MRWEKIDHHTEGGVKMMLPYAQLGVRKDWQVAIGELSFLVTSTIRAGQKPLSYSNIRSIYSSEERLNQTQETIRSIRNRVKDARVVVLENSCLEKNERELLNREVDLLVLFCEEREAIDLRDGPYKGAAEVWMLLKMMELLQPLAYRQLFKISGRYQLTEDFSLSAFPSDQFGMRLREGSYSTRLYAFPKSLEDIYIKQLNSALKATRKGMGVERCLMKGVAAHRIAHLSRLGVAGRIAVDGNLIEE